MNQDEQKVSPVEEKIDGEEVVDDVEVDEVEVSGVEELIGEEAEEEGEVPNGPPTRSPILRHPSVREGELETCVFPGVYTLTDSVAHACEEHQDRTLYNWRPVARRHIVQNAATLRDFVTVEYGPERTLTYGEFWEMVQAFASGILRFHPELSKGSFLGLYLNTQKEWPMSMHGAMLAGLTVVTVYANLGFDSLVKCLNETRLSILVCEGDNVRNIDKHLHENCPSLQKLIVVGNITYRSKFFQMVSFFDLLSDGQTHPMESFPNRPRAEDLAVIMYTSGTTGDPKGVMMKHRSLCASCKAIIVISRFVQSDVYLSYLPMAHVFELVCHNALLMTGCLIGFGNPRTLATKPGGAKIKGDLEHVRPTILIGVPKVYDTVAKGVRAAVRAQSSLRQSIFNAFLRSKMAKIRDTGRRDVRVLGANLIFKQIRLKLGGRVRLLCSGGAPLAAESHIFLQAVLGKSTKVIQGYALTESTCGGFVQDPDAISFRTLAVGQPSPSVEACLESVPDMNYNVEDDPPQGEICLRGPSISDGYYLKPDVTSEVFGADGWFHTGDIGRINPDGSMSIVDRKKHLVKLAGGEYVALEQLEMLYGTSNFVAPTGICVIADPFQDHLVAVMLPDISFARQWRDDHGFQDLSIDELIEKPEFIAAVLDSFAEIHRADGRKSFERLLKVAVVNDEWLPENDMLTAANKLKRRCIAEKYGDLISGMYSGAAGTVTRRAAPVAEAEGQGLPAKFAFFKPAYQCQ